MLDKLLRIGLLFDFYGALLTEKQRQCLEMHFSSDLSLSEIASQLGVSRQAVYDIIHRSEQVLDVYEDKLGLVARYQQEQKDIQFIYEAVDELPKELHNTSAIEMILKKISKLIGKTEEV